MAIAVVGENLWCSCGNKLFIISHVEEEIKVGFLFQKQLCPGKVHATNNLKSDESVHVHANYKHRVKTDISWSQLR